MHIGTRIIELRKAHGLSTNKLAHMAGISQSYLRDLELGNKNPTVDTLSYICDALHISLETFFTTDTKEITPSLYDALHLLDEEEQNLLASLITKFKLPSE